MLKQICLYATFLWVGVLNAQSIENRLDSSREHYAQNQQEKIYVHTDRNYYTVGETIWYKTYNTIGIANILSMLSGINYIELIDPKNHIVSDQRVQLEMGLGAGSLTLADTLTEGTYRLRAYTNWMRNFPTDSYFEKTLVITNGRTDNVTTHTTLRSDGKDSFVAVELKTLNGNPLPKTTVRYQVIEGDKIVQRGSERTDEQGLILIKVTDKNKNKDIQLSFANLDERPVSKVIHTASIKPQSSVQVLPEGGRILAGALNNLGIKAIRTDGLGVKARLEIVNSQQEIVGAAETNQFGMGSISFLPSNQESYIFRALIDGEEVQQLAAPPIESSGMSFMVNNQNPNKLFAQVNLSDDQLSEEPMYMVLHHLGTPFYASRQPKNRNAMVYSVAKEALPSGVITISVLDANFQPVFERPIFLMQEQDFVPLQINIPNKVVGAREKVTVNIVAGLPVDTARLASLSASVVNLAKVQDTIDHNTNIYSALLLEADLQGHIESPGYYFSSGDHGEKLVDLDKLMLTQGWRKFDWQENPNAADTIKAFEPEDGLEIKGYTKKLGRKSAAPLSEVQLISTDNFTDYIDTISTEEGLFHFKNLLFPDSTKFLISAKDQKGKNNIDIVLDMPPPPTIDALLGGQNDANTIYLNELLASKQFFRELEQKGLMSNTIDIERVVVTRQEKKVPEHSRNLNGAGNADQILSWEDIELFPTLDMLNGRLLGVYFQGGIPYSTRSRAPMQVVLDGMYVEGDMLSTIPVMDIASIEVLRNINYTSIYGSFGANGLIIITTKIGSEGRLNYVPKGILSFTAKGISAAKQFYTPTYEVGSEQTFTNDLRTTIHWAPFVATDEDGNASFDFYTSDEPGVYRIILEGIDIHGRIGRKVVDMPVDNKIE
ncbi:hypothetical protein M8998_10970 [Sphingobacterium sp. lm-10]|uniref:hypothetical protein n=1 Tax=Sphingobacterium sp. lm-10 TaxID=2944904 RepID=UPI0020205C05|nr:hypothetical protein [Sphingobacterium sp. lm-10]MCL7988462.1 hypothetical protein [Sphingobacterium sp. lm-10]